MEVKLVTFKSDGTAKEFAISNLVSTIGRGKECTFRIPLVDISRKHCELTLGEEELRVRDLASSNGTFVNDRRINETALHAGDRLALGPVIFTVQIDGEPAQIAPPQAEAPAAPPAKAAPTPPPAAAEPPPAPSAAEPPPVLAEEDDVVDLEPDEATDMSEVAAEESDPIAALEALADQSRQEDEDEK